MTNQIKNVTDRLVDGFNDYFNNVESFDGRYVCGQLFLYGKAKACDVGMPDRYDGEDKVKVNYMLNWFTDRWIKYELPMLEMQGRSKKYRPFEDATITDLGKLVRPVDVTQYVKLLTAIVEARQFINLNKISSDEYNARINDLKVAEVTPYQPINLHIMFSNLLESVKTFLEKDYDGERIYPSATLTFFTATDLLKSDAYSMITHEQSLCVIKINNTYQFTMDTVTQTFAGKSIKELMDKNIPEALVLGLKNHMLLGKTLKQIENVLSVMEEIFLTLIKE